MVLPIFVKTVFETFDQNYFQEYPGPSQRVKKTLKVEKQSVSLKENGIQLNLTVIDTPGFGDSVSKVGCVFPIVVVSILPHAEFGPNEHREDASHLIIL